MIKSASVHERRFVSVRVEPDAIVMMTFSGRAPISVYSVEIVYDLARGNVYSCIVRGWPQEGKRTHKLLDRRVHDDYFRIDWLKEIVEKYRPGGKI